MPESSTAKPAGVVFLSLRRDETSYLGRISAGVPPLGVLPTDMAEEAESPEPPTPSEPSGDSEEVREPPPPCGASKKAEDNTSQQ